MIPSNNQDIEDSLLKLPDLVAEALVKWRVATLDREKVEALLHARFKGEDGDRTATDIKSLVHSSDERYKAVLEEIKAESEYNKLNDRLMSFKKLASLRTAF